MSIRHDYELLAVDREVDFEDPTVPIWMEALTHNSDPTNTRDTSNKEEEISSSLKYGFRLFCTTALHPLDYAKTLIQLGYEPIAPRPGRTLFGAKRLMLPNIFQYAYHIGTVDGFTGCFRGLSAKLLGNILSSYYGEKLANSTGLIIAKKPRKASNWDDDFALFIEDVQRDMVVHCAGVVISQPFHVISVRMMAQFIGREQIYGGLWQSVKEVWKTEGITGFFSGIVPRLMVELGCIAMTSTITYLFSRYVGQNRTIRSNVNTIAHFTVASWLYPYHVVSTCMIVNGSRLKAGNPPLMDHYFGWTDCYRRLTMTNDHKRGASFFFRTVARAQPGKLSGSPSSAPYPELK
uniref:Mitochondrial carrier n=1 Tax=Anopheles atroparvus TaxID=41427 RepID=A0A182J251_ANOAO